MIFLLDAESAASKKTLWFEKSLSEIFILNCAVPNNRETLWKQWVIMQQGKHVRFCYMRGEG